MMIKERFARIVGTIFPGWIPQQENPTSISKRDQQHSLLSVEVAPSSSLDFLLGFKGGLNMGFISQISPYIFPSIKPSGLVGRESTKRRCLTTEGIESVGVVTLPLSSKLTELEEGELGLRKLRQAGDFLSLSQGSLLQEGREQALRLPVGGEPVPIQRVLVTTQLERIVPDVENVGG